MLARPGGLRLRSLCILYIEPDKVARSSDVLAKTIRLVDAYGNSTEFSPRIALPADLVRGIHALTASHACDTPPICFSFGRNQVGDLKRPC